MGTVCTRCASTWAPAGPGMPYTGDVVIPVPDSSIPAAIGYAHASGIPYNDGFIKNRYIGRTFIEPTDSLRKQGVALKFNVIDENVLRQTRGHDR